MSKLITTRYAAKCRKCRLEIPASTKAYWRKGYGTYHLDCPSNETEARKSDTPEMPTHTVGIQELKTALFACFDGHGETVVSGESPRKWITRLLKSEWNDADSWMSEWTGCTRSEMRQWLTEGFQVEGLADVSPELFPAKPRRKLRFSDEGDEMLLDMAWSGEDEPFIQWDKRESKPGMKIEISAAWNCQVDSKIIAAYSRWIAQAIQSIEEAGYDCEIVVSLYNDQLCREHNGKMSRTEIRVKAENEASDFASWSAMLSPGGYRMLGFLAWVMAVDTWKGTVGGGLGHAVSHGKWDVDWNEETRTLKIGEHPNPRDFPEFEMTEKLRSILQGKQGG